MTTNGSPGKRERTITDKRGRFGIRQIHVNAGHRWFVFDRCHEVMDFVGPEDGFGSEQDARAYAAAEGAGL